MTTLEKPIRWLEGKTFAFTIFDDTDLSTLENVPPVYNFLTDLGFRITKSAWPLESAGERFTAGTTCQNEAYRAWVLSLQKLGHEIGFHGASYGTSQRAQIRLAMDLFREWFGKYPLTMANHSRCGDNIYWGLNRLSGRTRMFYNLATQFRELNRYRGHIEGEPLFWGDLCKERGAYMRNFVFPEINTLRARPYMPYYDPKRPYVNAWFASTEGAVADKFVKTLSDEHVDSLEAQGGASWRKH